MKKIFYRAEEGDGVLSVAQKLDVPVTKLINDNRLTREIEAGDLLYVEKEEGFYYTVKPWDTMESVAAKFKVRERVIWEKNGEIPYLFYGLKIKI